jgi:SAM-dependent methyltransferase
LSDKAFVGSIPEVYDRCLGPMLFHPYAEDLVRRLAGLNPERVLELAAGTGIVTAEAARVLPPGTELVATDLSQAMLDVAARKVTATNVTFRTADAQRLPFPDGSFDAVVCQFGVMFLPDRAAAYEEMRRVLRPGGTLLFNTWDRVEASPIVSTVDDALVGCFPDDPPRFMRRTPHGYHDPEAIRAAVAAAGFGVVAVEAVVLPSAAPSARDVAVGFCQGTPVFHEITARASGSLDAVVDVVTRAVADRFGPAEVRSDMRAFVVTASV